MYKGGISGVKNKYCPFHFQTRGSTCQRYGSTDINSQCHINTKRGSRWRRIQCERPRTKPTPTPNPQPPKRKRDRRREKDEREGEIRSLRGNDCRSSGTGYNIFLSDATWWINLSAIFICYFKIRFLKTAITVTHRPNKS